MARRLYMVHEGQHPLNALTDIADGEFAFDRADWESFKPEYPRTSSSWSRARKRDGPFTPSNG